VQLIVNLIQPDHGIIHGIEGKIIESNSFYSDQPQI